MTFFPNCTTTSVGSLPHKDPVAAAKLILEYCPKVPAWPQLPNLDFKQSMYVQYAYDFSGVVLDEVGKRLFLDVGRIQPEELGRLSDKVMEQDENEPKYQKEYFAGFYEMLDLAKESTGIQILKGQITGPLSLGLKLTDRKNQAIIYDGTLFELLMEHLQLKAIWQQKALSEVIPETLIVFDEPYMTMFGSAFLNLHETEVIDIIRRVTERVPGLVGLHCCGNTDWGVMMETGVDVISLDAFNAGEVLALYRDRVKEFLDRGGMFAWGIVPSIPDDFTTETKEDLLERLQKAMGLLIKQGIELDTLLRQSFVSPSCGLGGMQEAMAEEALRVSKWISDTLRERHGLVD